MWRKLASSGAGVQRSCRSLATKASRSPSCSPSSPPVSSASSSAAVDSVILRSLKDHYLEVSNMAPPPVHPSSSSATAEGEPASALTIVKGALDSSGAVLRRTYGADADADADAEQIDISVMRLANIIPGGGDSDDDDGGQAINQLFLHVDISKPNWDNHLHFLCGLYPDALGIHSVSLRSKVDHSAAAASGFIRAPTKYGGPTFQELDVKTRDAFHSYIEVRGVNESLFPFLQAWLYVKDHRNLMRWFKTVGSFINERKTN